MASDERRRIVDVLLATYPWANAWFAADSVVGCDVGYKVKTPRGPTAVFHYQAESYDAALKGLAEQHKKDMESCS